MLRTSLVLAALCAVAAPAVADTPAVTVVAKKTSWKAAPKQPVMKVVRQPDGITLVVRWGGAVCNATWTTDGATVHAELNVDAPATRSCRSRSRSCRGRATPSTSSSITPRPSG